MTRRLLYGLCIATVAYAQTKIDATRQVRNALPYSSGGTNAATQIDARRNVGTPHLVATDFAGADIGAKVNSAFASFGVGQCGTVLIPAGLYTYSTTIYIGSGCVLTGAGRGNGSTGDALAAAYGTRLVYNGPPASVAISLGASSGGDVPGGPGKAYWASLRNISLWSAADNCPSGGMLKWNPGAAGSNKWQCYDGVSYTAATAQLAGIHHGQIDPGILSDGAHIVVENVDIQGTKYPGGSTQGAFHFGVWFNGCEECVVQSVYASGADDGFSFGPSANGVLANQITARGNKRSGIHVRWQNAITFVAPLMESNTWLGHASTPGFGVGFLCDSEDLGASLCRATLRDAYFEGNWLDISAPDSANPFEGTIDGAASQPSTISGYFRNAALRNCAMDNANNVHVVANAQFSYDCQILSGTIDKASNAVVTKFNGQRPVKVEQNTSSEMIWQYEPLPDSGQTPMTFTSTHAGAAGIGGILFNNKNDATAANNMWTPFLTFAGRGWKTDAPASSQRVAFHLSLRPQTGGSQPSGYLSFVSRINGSDDLDANGTEVAKLYTSGVFQSAQFQAQTVTPAAAVQAAAGTGAACAADTSYGVSDMSGQLTLTTGTGGWGAGAQCTVTFANTLSGWVTLTPANAAAAAAMNARQVYVDRGGNQFALSFGVADAAQTTYKFNWHAIGNFN